MLRPQRLPEHSLRQPHVGHLLDLLLTAVPAVGRQRQGTVEKRGYQAEERERNKELEEREAAV